MILEIYQDLSKSKRGTKKIKFQCDQCACEFTRRFKKLELTKEFNYCSVRCRASSSNTKRKFLETCHKKFGSHPMNNPSVRQRVRNTNIERYGVANPFQSSKIMTEEVLRRQSASRRARFLLDNGTPHPMGKKATRDKAKETCQKRYGGSNPMASQSVRDKISDTCMKRYGVTCGVQMKKSIDRAQSQEAKLKAHQTMKKNGSYAKSQAEDRFYDYLCSTFGTLSANIERQVRINNWSVDFKIGETYIQFDGIYWHGLNRPLQEIKSSKSPRDEVILKTFYRDQEQNKWFKENNLKLIRVTDKEFEKEGFSLTL